LKVDSRSFGQATKQFQGGITCTLSVRSVIIFGGVGTNVYASCSNSVNWETVGWKTRIQLWQWCGFFCLSPHPYQFLGPPNHQWEWCSFPSETEVCNWPPPSAKRFMSTHIFMLCVRGMFTLLWLIVTMGWWNHHQVTMVVM